MSENKEDILNSINPENTEKTEKIIKEEKTIFDINIVSIKEIVQLLIMKKYDFVTFEPKEDKVKIEFRKNKVVVDTRYIKFHIYSEILLKIKSVTNMDLWITDVIQEWKWELVLNNIKYEAVWKTVPDNFWEKSFFKLKQSEKQRIEKKEVKKTSFWQIFSFFLAVFFIFLIIWWGFLSFVVLNAKNVEDVKFFESLGISLNDINSFVGQLVTIIFMTLVFVETLFLIIVLFKFFLTKKWYKQRKMKFWLLAVFLFLITFSTGVAWKFLDDKVRALPKWDEEARWNIQLYDNSKYKSSIFRDVDAFINVNEKEENKNLIWPIDIKFDLKYLENKYERTWFKIKKYIWNFGWESKEVISNYIIKRFDKKWLTDIKLTLELMDKRWEITKKPITNVPSINIKYLVDIKETIKDSDKIVEFDAENLRELWKIRWYYIDWKEIKKVYDGYNYMPFEPISEETAFWLYIDRNDKENKIEDLVIEKLDKIFVIEAINNKNLDAKIDFEKDKLDELKYIFKVKDIKNDKWSWYVEQYIWTIDDKDQKSLVWRIQDPIESSKLTFNFKKYGKHKIKLELVDSSGESKIINKEIDIDKPLRIEKWLEIYADWKKVEAKYDKNKKYYEVTDLWVPVNLEIIATNVKTDNIWYNLEKVSWDFDNDGTIDEVNGVDKLKKGKYQIVKPWSHNMRVVYEFRNNRDKITKPITEIINFISETKESIVDFKIIQDSDYAPSIVEFDASIANVEWKDISNFEWHYGDKIDGKPVIDISDNSSPKHKYLKAWEYNIKLIVITKDWRKYIKEKKLVLKPPVKKAKITVSTKKKSISTGWEISFFSSASRWEISSYYWNFWENNEYSIEANPTHIYEKPWKYKVKLEITFSNKNVMTDEIEIEITK